MKKIGGLITTVGEVDQIRGDILGKNRFAMDSMFFSWEELVQSKPNKKAYLALGKKPEVAHGIATTGKLLEGKASSRFMFLMRVAPRLARLMTV